MKVKIREHFLVWYADTNQHLIRKKLKAKELTEELEEYVNDVLIEHIESMEELLGGDDDSPDSGFIEE